MKNQPVRDTFFKLTSNVADRLLKINLTAAEWRVWCYLVSLDPFGDRGAKFSPAKLMLKCGIKKTTYFATKAKFKKLELFDFREDLATKVVNRQNLSSNSDYSQQAEDIESENTESQSENTESQSENTESQSENTESQSENTESQSENTEFQSPKTPPDKDLKTPQTIQTYSDFKQTLSEDERENFLKFVEEKTKNLSQEINDIEAWLASTTKAQQNRWEVYYEKYLNQKRKESLKNSSTSSLTEQEKRSAIANWHKKMDGKMKKIEIIKQQESQFKEEESSECSKAQDDRNDDVNEAFQDDRVEDNIIFEDLIREESIQNDFLEDETTPASDESKKDENNSLSHISEDESGSIQDKTENHREEDLNEEIEQVFDSKINSTKDTTSLEPISPESPRYSRIMKRHRKLKRLRELETRNYFDNLYTPDYQPKTEDDLNNKDLGGDE